MGAHKGKLKLGRNCTGSLCGLSRAENATDGAAKHADVGSENQINDRQKGRLSTFIFKLIDVFTTYTWH